MDKTLSLRGNEKGLRSFKATSASIDSTHFFCPNCSCEKFDLNSIVFKFQNSHYSNQIELLPMSRSELHALATFLATAAKLGRATYLDHIPGIRIYVSSSPHDFMFRKLQITIDNNLCYQVLVKADELFRLAVAVGQTGKTCIHAKSKLALAA